LGKVAPVFTTLTLIIILFEGGLGLDLKVLSKSLVGATGLTAWSFLATLAVIAPLSNALLGMDWLQSFTLATAIAGTSSAMVIPVVKRLALGEKTKTILTLESAISDVLTLVVVLALVEAQANGNFSINQIFSGIFTSFLLAAVIGGLAGMCWSLALHWLHSRGLKKSIFTTPAFVLVIYGLVGSMGFSGVIAALMVGITLGNIRALPPAFLKKRRDLLDSPNETELAVFEEVAFLLKTLFFVYVGTSIQFTSTSVIFVGLVVTAALFLLRIPVIRVSLIPRSSFTRFEAAISGAMNPKGLAAAVAASIPLHREIMLGKEDLFAGQKIQSTVFTVILFSIVVASVLFFIIERGWFNRMARALYGSYPDEQRVGNKE
jgi:NhaP-type Na+/H+ or K+/H+ antiporter